ncbi:MAG: peptide-methionine (S)-S-oxide reductase MsrA [Planctomycetaceae bacterium]
MHRQLVAVPLALALAALWGRAALSNDKAAGAAEPKVKTKVEESDGEGKPAANAKKLERATFGSGCFWCTEAVFQRLKGVESVVSGYSGGHVENPTYQQVSSKLTGHAEVVQVTYDPAVISYPELLEVFWKTHDPTTPNQQGADVGPQYRSVIFYHTEEQKELAEKYALKLTKASVFDDPIVTQIVPFEKFYPAENYHQNYYNNNSRAPYCRSVIGPKLTKLKKVFREKLK